MNLSSFSLSVSGFSSPDISSDDLSQGLVVLFVYPKDNTPGCTMEARDFRDHYESFQEIGVQIFGLSKDSIASHERFAEKQCLPFSLISDPDLQLLQALGVWKEKSMYGKTFLGIERSTFLFRDGELIQEWRKVKVRGHVQEVLAACQKL